jgi:chitodextrinase
MKKIASCSYGFLLAAVACVLLNCNVDAATITAASCELSAVQGAINSANDGDTILIPNGTCAWSSGISTSKQLWIRAQYYTPTPGGNTTRNVIIINNASVPLFRFTTGNSYHSALSGIRLNEGTGTNNALEVNGNGSKVMLLSDMFFEVKQRNGASTEVAVLDWAAQGGVIWNTRFVGIGTGTGGSTGPDGASFVIKNMPRVWETPSTMGALDSSGDVNLYIEACSCLNVGQLPDLDDHGRAVLRHNTFDGCGGGTHAFTSARGGRHIEYYNNTFNVSTELRNHNGRYYWIRGGTALFTDNTVNNATYPGAYGSPVFFSIGDNTTPGSYPMPRQPGFGHDGINNVSDPIYSWNNTGSRENAYGFENGWGSIVQLNRDVFVNNGAKPGYSKYTYPHPLRTTLGSPSPSDTTPPSAPSGLSATAASTSQINLTWTASTDNVSVSGYRVERCQGSSCSNFAQIAAPTTTSYSETGLQASTTYRYRVLAVDSAGNTSAYSAIAAATTQVAPDTTAPSTPASLTTAAFSSSQINLTWNPSTDNVSVTGYILQRCQGSSCSGFAQIATPSGTTYSDIGLAASTSYRYRVAARDAAGNVSAYSSIATGTTQASQTGAPPALPEGATGIAAMYPGDANIAANSSVIFADNFESYTSVSQLSANWSQLYGQSTMRIATEAPNVYSGARALEFRVPQQTAEFVNAALKTVSPAESKLFVRVYTKFDSGYAVLGSNHNGITISANYSNPGVRADGTNKFLVDVENSRDLSAESSPGATHVYTYHPEQRDIWGDHWYPDGRVIPFDSTPGNFGPYFVPRPNFIPELNRWYCYELMVQANTPGQRDGRVAVWIDGTLIADFQNIRLRDVDSLKIDKFDIGLHVGSNTIRQNLKWYDNVVAARSYIGPMLPPAGGPPSPPTDLSVTVR